MTDLLRHWHPVLKQSELKNMPRSFLLLGEEFVLFRDADKNIGCLKNSCPHRRMPLSCGKVRGNHITCRYHGWSFDTNGVGCSPGNPNLTVRANTLETATADGFIWVRRPGSASILPNVDVSGFIPAGNLNARISAPLMLTLDNFSEVEHTASVHKFLGYTTKDLAGVRIDILKEDTHIRVINTGLQRPIPSFLRRLLSLQEGDVFVDDWTTYFSPVYSVFDHYIFDPTTGKNRPDQFRSVLYLTPEGDDHTQVFASVYVRSTRNLPTSLKRMMSPFFRFLVNQEIQLDVDLLAHMKDKSTSLKGMKLGRFDKVLGLNRAYADRLYYGR